MRTIRIDGVVASHRSLVSRRRHLLVEVEPVILTLFFMFCALHKRKIVRRGGSVGFTPTNIPVLCSLTEWIPS